MIVILAFNGLVSLSTWGGKHYTLLVHSEQLFEWPSPLVYVTGFQKTDPNYKF